MVHFSGYFDLQRKINEKSCNRVNAKKLGYVQDIQTFVLLQDPLALYLRGVPNPVISFGDLQEKSKSIR